MTITIVIGGQFGGEGKGKITAHLCRNQLYDIAVRCGGPNSGHNINLENGEQYGLRMIPSGVAANHTKLFLAAGCLIDLEILSKEVQDLNIDKKRILIDRNAVIMRDYYSNLESSNKLEERIGSTCTGTGIAVAKRVLRDKDIIIAKNCKMLKKRGYLTANISDMVINASKNKKRIVIEGTQGFGLSVYHSPYYPYTTSRDTTAAGFISEIGLSPFHIKDIIMVMRTYPIRTRGNSGPLPLEILPQETAWKDIQKESGYPYEIKELGTVTKIQRRVAKFDFDIVKRAFEVNAPTVLALMGIDYLEYENKGLTKYRELTPKAIKFIKKIESELKKEIRYIGIGPSDYEIIDRLRANESEKTRIRERETEKNTICI